MNGITNEEMNVRLLGLDAARKGTKYVVHIIVNTLQNTNVWLTFLVFGFNFWGKQDEFL